MVNSQHQIDVGVALLQAIVVLAPLWVGFTQSYVRKQEQLIELNEIKQTNKLNDILFITYEGERILLDPTAEFSLREYGEFFYVSELADSLNDELNRNLILLLISYIFLLFLLSTTVISLNSFVSGFLKVGTLGSSILLAGGELAALLSISVEHRSNKVKQARRIAIFLIVVIGIIPPIFLI